MSRTIRLTGSGTATATPDVVIARIGVEFRAGDVATAFSGAGEAARAVVAAAHAAGVSSGDVATSDVGLQAVETGPWEDRRLEGYAASESLTVTVRSVGDAAAVLQAAATAAGDAARIQSVTFALSDGAGPAAAAREAAFTDARTRAEQYAALSGDALGAVLAITDDPAPGPRAEVHFAAKSMAAAPAGPAMEAGERAVTARVTVEWELV
ncbi:SIMPL domain-containing protein [Tsukamurella paurometabola]|uniref:26 kDa periplasmic immunogenic protein n=1 Tax=Tsukamurella paurometabola TaxID=2061 RepID=A0A3P8KI63_TSUPA|nr:SIMPL domain-containing protein [Tsukamurella paurometabola]UEA82901.1 SIMPL domain-containing protein [Tsukamurella paurometabola]VDR39978.1 26 kDa periplasmic immunogenic protein precursor [Tsukamurella paurometabola]